MDRFIKTKIMKYLNTIVAIFFATICSAQFNTNFSYQGLLLDENGKGLEEIATAFVISISEDINGNTIYYQEAQMAVTDDSGVFDLVIGNGDAINGSMEDVDWLSSVPFIGIQYDLFDGNGIRDLGYAEFYTVPFCYYSKYVVCQKGPDGDHGGFGAVGNTGATGATGAGGPTGLTGAMGYFGLPITPMLNLTPSFSEEGTIYLDDGTNREDGVPGFRYYDGAAWLDL